MYRYYCIFQSNVRDRECFTVSESCPWDKVVFRQPEMNLYHSELLLMWVLHHVLDSLLHPERENTLISDHLNTHTLDIQTYCICTHSLWHPITLTQTQPDMLEHVWRSSLVGNRHPSAPRLGSIPQEARVWAGTHKTREGGNHKDNHKDSTHHQLELHVKGSGHLLISLFVIIQNDLLVILKLLKVMMTARKRCTKKWQRIWHGGPIEEVVMKETLRLMIIQLCMPRQHCVI